MEAAVYVFEESSDKMKAMDLETTPEATEIVKEHNRLTRQEKATYLITVLQVHARTRIRTLNCLTALTSLI
jgi:hypothetical protein